ncbi:DUF992 domain-containing protein [Rhizobium sp.]
MKNTFAIALTAASMLATASLPAFAADTVVIEKTVVERETDTVGGVKIGTLTCNIGEGGGYVLGSAKEVDCTFHSSLRGDGPDDYVGTIKKLGIDLGYTARGKIVWAVFAPTAGYHTGSLSGSYLGAAAEATLGAGIGANVLLGGTGGSIQLQPISVSGQLGLNIAAAGTNLTLKSVN